jgi:hypothetical protein
MMGKQRAESSQQQQRSETTVRTILVCILITVSLLTVSVAQAQEPKTIPKIDYLAGGSPSSESANLAAFRRGMHELGYVEDKTSQLSTAGQRGNRINSPTSPLSLFASRLFLIQRRRIKSKTKRGLLIQQELQRAAKRFIKLW